MSNNVHYSADFQCDQTGGYPAILCYDQDEGIAWLELNENLAGSDDLDNSEYEQMCKDWGMRPCCSWDEYNELLKSLGEEAYENAAYMDQDMPETGINM